MERVQRQVRGTKPSVTAGVQPASWKAEKVPDTNVTPSGRFRRTSTSPYLPLVPPMNTLNVKVKPAPAVLTRSSLNAWGLEAVPVPFGPSIAMVSAARAVPAPTATSNAAPSSNEDRARSAVGRAGPCRPRARRRGRG